MTARVFSTLFRKYVNDGVPSSGAHWPVKNDIVDTFDALLGANSLTAANVRTHLRLDNSIDLKRDFGAIGDLVVSDTGAATATDETFTDANAAFTSADVGKPILIAGAGAAGAHLMTTIAAYNSPTSIELADAASTTVAATRYQYGTDDTAAWKAWNDAANAAGSVHRHIPAGKYWLASLDEETQITNACMISGAGMGVSEIYWYEDSTPLDLFAFPTPLDHFAVRDFSIVGTHHYRRSTLSAFPLLVENTSRFHAENVEIAFSRTFGIACRSASFASAKGCHVHHCSSDGINFANCQETLIAENRLHHLGDDAIAVHNQIYSYQRGHIVANNKIRMAQGIKMLGAQVFSVTGNVLEFFIAQGISVQTFAPGSSDIEGVSASVDGVISGNVFSDPINRNGLDAANSGVPCFLISGASASDGSLSVIPGLQGTSPYPYYDNVSDAGDNLATTPIPPSGRILITGNVVTRSMPKSGDFSDLGFGEFWLSDGEYDLDLSVLANSEDYCLRILSAPVEAVVFSNNIINSVSRMIYLPSSGLLTAIKAVGNVLRDCSGGVLAMPSNTNVYDVEFRDCDFDIDTYHENANRSADGSFAASGNPTAFLLQGGKGIGVHGCTFRNVCRITDTDFDAGIRDGLFEFTNCRIVADPAASGFSTSNKGVGYVPTGFTLIHADCDPTSGDYGKITLRASKGATSIPTSGTFIRGEFVHNITPSVSTGKTLIGWLRLTTGSGHVSGTDWSPCYVTTS